MSGDGVGQDAVVLFAEGDKGYFPNGEIPGPTTFEQGLNGDGGGAFGRKTKDARADSRKGKGFKAGLVSETKAVHVALSQEIGLPPLSAVPDRTHPVNHMPRRQIEPRRQARLPCGASAQCPAKFEKV
ncbi:hypothetical protein GCM10007924_28300 [Sneathiella chinensis]|uniref:Uncharacterized protein n=1 Tax=Sneathiella chinensis TaxID=349750 RepID=A0ABQ5U651_9PROT|nr:hypothetical protein GCM10007924_28300 [Sneathiella chinensis]